MRGALIIILVLVLLGAGCADIDVTCEDGECRPLHEEDRDSIVPEIRNETRDLRPLPQ